MAISPDLLLAILSLDSYNRGYGEGIEGLGGVGSKVGPAEIIRESDTQKGSEEVSAGFYAIAYKLDKAVEGLPEGSVIISYRGTDNPGLLSTDSDIWRGWTFGAGFTIAAGTGFHPVPERFGGACGPADCVVMAGVKPCRNVLEGNGPSFRRRGFSTVPAGVGALWRRSGAGVFPVQVGLPGLSFAP